MLGNFSYCNPTKLYFGENSLSNLSDELRKYGDNVVLVYGTGSIKKNGIYDDIIKILKESNKNMVSRIYYFSGIRGSYFRRSRRKKARSRLCYRRYGRS